VLTINTLPDISFIPATDTLYIGDSTLLSSNTFDAEWSISDSLIATIDTIGLVRGVNSGIATAHIVLTNPLTGCSNSANTVITVLPINYVPNAINDVYTTVEDSTISGHVGDNDTLSIDGGNTFTLNTNPSNGLLIFNNGTFTYTPNPGFVGSDTFRYTLCDTNNDCKQARVIIIVEAAAPVPVTLTYFTARLDNKNVNKAILNWNTQSEINTQYYDLERSFDGVFFDKRANVQAIGTSYTSQDYQYLDDITEIDKKIIYYRLKIVDNNGLVNYSAVIPLKLGSTEIKDEIKVYPNPFVSTENIQIYSTSNQIATIDLYSSDGKLIKKYTQSLIKGSNLIILNSLDILPSAQYYLKIKMSNNTSIKKIVKQLK
jgi:hypothetical protein